MGDDNPFLNRNKTRKHGQKAEKRTALRINARRQPGSGSIDGLKGDLSTPEFLIENKTTEGQSLRLQRSWLSKISKEALEVSKTPAVAIQFVDREGRPVNKNAAWVMVPEKVWLEISQKDD